MIASPNYVRFVYDGDGSDTPTPVLQARRRSKMSSTTTSTRSDSLRPDRLRRPLRLRALHRQRRSGGWPLHRGRGHQVSAQAATYGGTAGVAYDHCYHQACDTINNLNHTGFDQMSDAAVTALTQLALLQGPLASAARTQALAHTGVQTEYRGSLLVR